jgi:hypothetical protein
MMAIRRLILTTTNLKNYEPESVSCVTDIHNDRHKLLK